jgi:glutamate/tyrosine decarboxylase-like PLP-dependent enzyme
MEDMPALNGMGNTVPVRDASNRRSFEPALRRAADLAIAHRAEDATAPPRPTVSASYLRRLLDVGLPDDGREGTEIMDMLARAAGPGLVRNTGPDFFAWVMGASHPVGVAADWLTSAWGQNAAIYGTSPAAAIVEEVVAAWLLDLLRLPSECSVGFATGATMASFACLAAARAEVLLRAGYDLEADGLIGAPPVTAFVSDEVHITILSVLRLLGFGRRNIVAVATDRAGRMRPEELRRALAAREGAKIVVGQAGHINSGAFDPFPEIAALVRAHRAWLHVDGAFGLWARAVPELDRLCEGLELADSWSVDGHKWLQVPYDSGFAIVRDARTHKRAMDTSASYLTERPDDGRNPTQFGPELSRRARGFAPWAVLQALGRNGVSELVRHHCRLARNLAERLSAEPGIEVMNEVDLNQVAVRCLGGAIVPDADDVTDRVIAELGRRNLSFVEGTTWKGRRVIRISVISSATESENIERLEATIVDARRRVLAEATQG